MNEKKAQQPGRHIVVSINGEGPTNLRVACSCGWVPSMGGAIEYVLPLLKTLLKQHDKPGHHVCLNDPFRLMDDVNDLPMVS